ncbi:MAG: hypothetical protein CR988_08170 [Treponema sp.]|nr:MAG: hypothetical protein CR988_08170 [Treponema sp.]
MQMLEKFYTDILKATKQKNYTEAVPKLFRRQVSMYDKSLNDFAEDMSEYWLAEYSTSQSKTEIADWFYKLLSFFTEEFEADMDFSKRDWEEIKFSLSSTQDNMDIELLNSFMSILVERKKL